MFEDFLPSLLSKTNLDFKRSVDITVRLQSPNSDSTRMAKQDNREIFWVRTKEKQTQTITRCYCCGGRSTFTTRLSQKE
ncbi:hypothetical protein HZS_1734 [Henneguya salminicola]|nr:hypothetical protein HZS_1734 [Henneguya salminicola]